VDANFSRIFMGFAQIFRDFSKVFTDFAQISTDFGRIFTKSKHLGVRLQPLNPRLLHHCFTDTIYPFAVKIVSMSNRSNIYARRAHQEIVPLHLIKNIY